MHDVFSQFLTYLRGVWRRRWYAVVVAWLVCLVGWTIVHRLPDQYEARARVYVDTQSILRPLLSGLTVTPNVDQTINMMTRTLASRPNLEKVARMTDLDLTAKDTAQMEALLDGLAANIKLEGGSRDNLYTISYQNADPELAKRVVQSLLTLYVEGSLGGKRKDVDSARRFLDEQIHIYEQRLVSAENSLKEFKQKNLGFMPSEGSTYLDRLRETNSALSQAQLSLREAETRRDSLKRQLSGDEPVMVAETVAGIANPEIDGRIQELQKKLDGLRLTYTEKHPDIVATRRIIEDLEKEKAEGAKKNPVVASSGFGQSPYFQQLSLSLAEAEANVASLRARVGEFQARLDSLRAAADRVPQIEADLTQLSRDYDVNKKNYETLLARRETAQISEDMGEKTDVVDFKIIDPPRAPSAPSWPNRPLLISMVLLAGLGAGILLAFIVSQLRKTVDDRQGLREFTGLPLLGAVSMMWSPQQQKKRRKGLIAYLFAFGSLLGAYAFVLAWTLMTARVA